MWGRHEDGKIITIPLDEVGNNQSDMPQKKIIIPVAWLSKEVLAAKHA